MKKSFFLIIALSLFSCSSRTNISEIKQHPREYFEKEVTVEGTVKNTFSLMFVNYFLLSDNTDSIHIVTSKPLPNNGEFLRITGEVMYYSFGDKKIIAIKEYDE